MGEIEGLQLDRAEFDGETTPTSCRMCSAALTDSYYDVNGETTCAACCESLRGLGQSGNSLTRATRAAAAGAGAALAGAGLYYAILALSGYEFGLIAIVVGMAVGKAVNWGSYGRGGWRYQAMAMVLTYVAIVGSYVPLLIAEMRKLPVPTEQAEQGAAPGAAAAAVPTHVEVQPDGAQAIKAVLLLAGFVLVIPFLAGLENIIGIIIIGIGLYEAWKFNRRPALVITGPHTIAAPQTT